MQFVFRVGVKYTCLGVDRECQVDYSKSIRDASSLKLSADSVFARGELSAYSNLATQRKWASMLSMLLLSNSLYC